MWRRRSKDKNVAQGWGGGGVVYNKIFTVKSLISGRHWDQQEMSAN